MSNNFENIVQEVENDLRQEKFEKIWKEYGKKIITIFAGVVILSAAYNFWQHNQIKQRDVISQQFSQAQTLIFSKNYSDALAAMESIAKSSHHMYSSLAKFNIAGILRQDSERKDLNKAAEIYKELMQSKSVNANVRDLASLLYVGLKIDSEATDTQQLSELLQTVDSITKKDSCYKFMAFETKGMIHYKMKDNQAASEAFMAVAQGDKAPRDAKLRSQVMLQHLTNLNANVAKESK